jgi:hypothetical protein
MQIHVTLIPISSTQPLSTSPGPPEHIYHYTTGLKLRSIINSGHIRPTTARIEPHEKPVAWFSTQNRCEPTATKVPTPGLHGQIETAKAQGGLVRIAVPGTCAPYVFPQLPLIAGTSPAACSSINFGSRAT